MYIDPHVHCRDGKQSYKETIKHALYVAERARFTAIFDMPNTDPPITTEELVKDRIKKSEEAKSKVFYGIYLALKSNEEQIKNSVEIYNKYAPAPCL